MEESNSPSGTVASFPAAQVGRLGWGGVGGTEKVLLGSGPERSEQLSSAPCTEENGMRVQTPWLRSTCVGNQGHPSVSHTKLRSGYASPEPSWGANLNLPPPVQEELFNVYYLSLAQMRKGFGFGKFLPENWN